MTQPLPRLDVPVRVAKNWQLNERGAWERACLIESPADRIGYHLKTGGRTLDEGDGTPVPRRSPSALGRRTLGEPLKDDFTEPAIQLCWQMGWRLVHAPDVNARLLYAEKRPLDSGVDIRPETAFFAGTVPQVISPGVWTACDIYPPRPRGELRPIATVGLELYSAVTRSDAIQWSSCSQALLGYLLGKPLNRYYDIYPPGSSIRNVSAIRPVHDRQDFFRVAINYQEAAEVLEVQRDDVIAALQWLFAQGWLADAPRWRTEADTDVQILPLGRVSLTFSTSPRKAVR